MKTGVCDNGGRGHGGHERGVITGGCDIGGV